MSDANPILLLMIALLELGHVIVWGLCIYVAAVLSRRAGHKRWPWVLLAIVSGLVPGGPVFLATAVLAQSYRRILAVWLLEQVFFFAGVLALVLVHASWFVAAPPLLGLGMLLAAVVVALSPVMTLGLIGPKRLETPDGADGKVILQAKRLRKSYDLGGRELRVLNGVSLSVKRGEFLAILGTSGSGKSTLLHVLGMLDRPDSGSLALEDVDSTDLSGPQRDRVRCTDIGFVFQFYHLLPELNVVDNVLLPSMTVGSAAAWPARRGAARERAIKTLKRLGLGERLGHRPRQLSGGEQQRVAIARGLANEPKILLADEPTGNLDSTTGAEIIALLKELNRESGQTIVMVTHDEHLAERADRILHLRDGKLA